MAQAARSLENSIWAGPTLHAARATETDRSGAALSVIPRRPALVTPANAGVQVRLTRATPGLDSGFRRNDEMERLGLTNDGCLGASQSDLDRNAVERVLGVGGVGRGISVVDGHRQHLAGDPRLVLRKGLHHLAVATNPQPNPV